jgi:Ca-activated chloride channel family protein
MVERLLVIGALLFAGLAYFAWPGEAKQPSTPASIAAPSPTPTPEIQSGTVFIREVRVPITVLDKTDQPVAGLTQYDFQVYEDKKLQKLVSFRDEKDNLPIYAVVLMDTSPSSAGKFRFEQDAAKSFIYSVVHQHKDKVAFATFDDEIKLRLDFTDRLGDLDRAVESVKTPGNKTALYDAIYQLCDEKMYALPGRRVLVIITDGEDTFSRASIAEAIEIAQNTETAIYIVSNRAGLSSAVPGVEAGLSTNPADKLIKQIAEGTGGDALFTTRIEDLDGAFAKIATELRSQYVATYVPLNNRYDGSRRRIEVKLISGKKGYRLQAKSGYQAVVPRN